MCIGFTALFQPPPLIEYFPVLHYVVSYNTSDNSTVIQTQLSSSISSYTVSSEPGVTYYITVRAVNAVGTGDINGYSIVNGEIKNVLIFIVMSSLYLVPQVSTITPTTATQFSTKTQLVHTSSLSSTVTTDSSTTS